MPWRAFFFRNLTTKQTLIKNTFWLGLAEIVAKLVMFVVTILVVRSFGPTNFGRLNLATAYAAIIVVFADFGLNIITTREIAKNKSEKDKYLSNIFTIKLIISLIIWLITVFWVRDRLILLVLTFSLLQNFCLLLGAVFSGLEAMQYNFISRSIYYLGLLAAAVWVTRTNPNPERLMKSYILTTSLAFIVTFFMLKIKKITLRPAFDFSFWRKIFKETLPFVGSSIIGVIYLNLDSILIGRYFGPEQVGFYQSAYKILFAFQSINIVNNSLFPRISALMAEEKYTTLKKLNVVVISLSLLGLIPLGVLMTILAKPIMRIIYGSIYVSAAPAMVCLIWSGIIFYFRNYVNNLLVAANQQYRVFYSLLAGTTVNALFNLLITPKFNFIYASIAMVLSELTILIYSSIQYARKEK
ncbi:MAG TPA: flippase [Candidatus Woesebacteria bacterium]|nr:flippase [Candidatus Woesebacteria bacterium]HRS22954.1 flippase [Candidatus Woesebacteria bacterium]HRT39855.1 flippase [Candidatus Woesebacteria bacterium]